MKVHIEPDSKTDITVSEMEDRTPNLVNSGSTSTISSTVNNQGKNKKQERKAPRGRKASVLTTSERLRAEVQTKNAPSLSEMVQKLTEEQIAEFKECFEMFDEDGSGTVDQKELGDILTAMGQKLSEKELDKMVAKVDLNGSGSVDFPEFCALMAWQMYSSGEELQLRKIFECCDEFGEGQVPKSSIRYIISNLVPDLSSEDMNEMLDSVKGTHLNFTQFHAIFQESEPNDNDVNVLSDFNTKSFKLNDTEENSNLDP